MTGLDPAVAQRAAAALGDGERLTGGTLDVGPYTVLRVEPPRDDQVLAYDPRDGTVRWRVLPPPGDRIEDPPEA